MCREKKNKMKTETRIESFLCFHPKKNIESCDQRGKSMKSPRIEGKKKESTTF